ncbi:hypothetical protein JCM10914A_39080 [Paenibacillus sp. JCM 10914]|uniref:hypothetical protein n=1 Tax=Paenibacillus sp. JCM 10914 TaxID=1236974 RepID=UPI0003CC975C|nr:hypothetical protein [Paenibacillus sp. JCM 10914]GAE04628.1 hypothetical protein JCM10914_682 [Paenibacillus sp. JCM 10914]
MEFEGFVIHHTEGECGEEAAWDFKIHLDGSVRCSSMLIEPRQIHICLEGDFNRPYEGMDLQQKSQLFMAAKIILELSRLHEISPLYLFPHSDSCPGVHFPWNSLVIYPVDGYH